MKYFEKNAASLPQDVRIVSEEQYKSLVKAVKRDARERKRKASSTAKGALSGAVAGAVGSIITHPIDTIMVASQTGQGQALKTELKTLDALGKAKRLMKGSGTKIGKNALMGATILGINQLLNK